MTKLINNPYSPSWIDKVQRVAKRFQLGPIGFYVLLGAVLTLVLHTSQWISGATEKFLFTLPLTWTASWTPLMLAMIYALDKIASRSLAQFRPAMGSDDEDYEIYDYRLTTMPSMPVILVQLSGTVIFIGTVIVAPSYGGMIFGKPISDAIVYVLFWLNLGFWHNSIE